MMKSGTKQIFLIFLAYYCNTCFSNIYFLFGPFYEGMGASPHEVGLFLSVFYFVMLLCRPLGSVVMERFDIRRALIGSSLLCAAMSAGIALSLASPLPLLFFRAMTGVCVSVFGVSAVAAQSILLDERSRGVGFALFTTGSMLPLATVIPLSEWLLKGGYNELYIWLPVLTALICAGICFPVRNLSYDGQAKRSWGSYSELFKTGGVVLLLFTAFTMSVADAMTLSAASLAEVRAVSVSWFMISSAFSGILIRTVAFRLVAMFQRSRLAATSAALMGFALLGLSFSSTASMFVLFGLLFGLGIGVGFPTDLALVGDILPEAYRPKATGLVLMVIDIGWMISPLLYGWLSPPIGVSNTFRVVGLAVFTLSMALYFKFWRPMALGRR
ncbi:MAG: MFS transporter [Synergistaceae bacterium]|nr:MFS transporter [Synergistaceae bacterium]